MGLPVNHGEPWTKEKNRRLKEKIFDGYSVSEIARSMGRTRSAIEHQCRKLNLIEEADCARHLRERAKRAEELLAIQNKKIGQIAYALAGYSPPEGPEEELWGPEAMAIYYSQIGEVEDKRFAVSMHRLHGVPFQEKIWK